MKYYELLDDLCWGGGGGGFSFTLHLSKAVNCDGVNQHTGEGELVPPLGSYGGDGDSVTDKNGSRWRVSLVYSLGEELGVQR